MQKKYELIEQSNFQIERCYQNGDGRRFIRPYRIKALIDIDIEQRPVKAGDMGGFVECEDNLSHDGLCWIFDDAAAIDGSAVMEDALLMQNARALDDAVISGKALLTGFSTAAGNSIVTEEAIMQDQSQIYGNAILAGKATMQDRSIAKDSAAILDHMTLRKDFVAKGESRYYGRYFCE